MSKHVQVVDFLPIFQRLDVIYVRTDGKEGILRKPAIALAVIRDEERPEIKYLMPMVSLNAARDIDLAHGYGVLGYDDGSEAINWEMLAEEYRTKTGMREKTA